MTRVLPQHEQHFPTSLLPHRLEEYVFDDGRPPTQIRHGNAVMVTGPEVLATLSDVKAQTGLVAIDDRYYVGTVFHESGCKNEWDTEVATQSSPKGFVSVGAYQIGEEEALHYGFTLEDMLDFVKATMCMTKLAETNRNNLRAALRLPSSAPDPVDMRAYLAMAHNKGCGFARTTIARYGMNWLAYKGRNPLDPLVAHGYGDDCLTGGPNWPKTP